MKVAKKVTVQGEWAKVKEDIKNGDIIIIADEGKLIPGEYGERNVFKIDLGNENIKLLTFNQTSMNNLIEALGEETNEWIGEKVKVWLYRSMVANKMRDIVYLTHPTWVEGEDGFYPPATSGADDGIPTIDDDYEH